MLLVNVSVLYYCIQEPLVSRRYKFLKFKRLRNGKKNLNSKTHFLEKYMQTC